VADEPTIGEVMRTLNGLQRFVEQSQASVQRSVEQLAIRVLTVEVWKAEREAIEIRLRENEKDIATLEARAEAERSKREAEKRAADDRASSMRRQAIFAVFTSVIAPIAVGVIIALVLKG
jgi:hypothetical protein